MAKRTPLYERHVALGARMVEFAGWEMPVQYSGVIAEHHAVRQRAGLFDVSHMGEFQVEGADALPYLNTLVTNDIAELDPWQAHYAILCKDDGGALDDLLVYHLRDDQYLVVVNASTTGRDFAWFQQHAPGTINLVNRSDATGLLALQGPLAQTILQPLTAADLGSLAYYHCMEAEVAGLACLVSRTGYTGEDGFELFVSWGQAPDLWDALLSAGKDAGLLPCGLGARDTLRLEAAMPLYGHELDEQTTPVEAGLLRFISFDKGDFIGRPALLRQKEEGPPKKLVGFKMEDRGIPREGYAIRRHGEPVGRVTSGSHSPTLNAAIGLGYIRPETAKVGDDLEIVIRDRPARARVVRRPFYKRQ